jgi:hypothetical protein
MLSITAGGYRGKLEVAAQPNSRGVCSACGGFVDTIRDRLIAKGATDGFVTDRGLTGPGVGAGW